MSDFDGKCSGAIVKSLYDHCEMIGVDYGNCDISGINIALNEVIFVVDFSFEKETMGILNNVANLIWIDHHRTSIEKMEGHTIQGKREIGKAACELTWEYIYPARQMPIAVKLLGRYDVWDHSDPRTLPFQYGMRLLDDTQPDSRVWAKSFLERTFFYETLENGSICYKYQTQQNSIYAASMSYEGEFEGYKAIIMNKPFANSQAFDSVYNPDIHDIMILWGCKQGEFKYSIYTDKKDLDVSEIAKKYGGGGHKNAAGFHTKSIII